MLTMMVMMMVMMHHIWAIADDMHETVPLDWCGFVDVRIEDTFDIFIFDILSNYDRLCE